MALYNIYIQMTSGDSATYQTEISAEADRFLSDFQDYLTTGKRTGKRYDFLHDGTLVRTSFDFTFIFSVSIAGVILPGAPSA
jgi:hypothetical protein